MDYLSKDNSVNALKNEFIITKSKEERKKLFEILFNQKTFNESTLNDYDQIKNNMQKLNVIYSNDLNNLDNTKVKEKCIILI